MKKLGSVKICFLACSALWLNGLVPSHTDAREPAREFVNALRERGYHDMAVEYLNSMKTSRLAPVEIKEILLYELGTTLVEASKTQRDIAIREKQLDEAREALRRFIGMHSDHELASSANNQLGNLLVERARIKIELAKKPGEDTATLRSDAGGLYDEAFKVFERAKVDIKEKLERIGTAIAPKDKEKLNRRDRLRADYLQAQLLAAAIKEEKADSVQKGSAEYTTLLTDAAALYADINKKYRTLLAGQFAEMYQGRCNQKMGNYKNALVFYNNVLSQPEVDAFRSVKTKTFLLAIECWQNSKPPLYAVAIEKLEPWIDKARPNEAKTPNWLQLRLELAKIQWEQAQKVKASDAKESRRLINEARKNATFVSRVKGDLQREAQNFLAEKVGIEQPDREDVVPTTFADAMRAGGESLDAMKMANMMVKKLPGRIAKEPDAAVKAQLKQQLEDAQDTIKTSLADAKRYYHMALGLADEDTEVRDINIVRYFLCFLHYSTKDYYKAGLVGEFVARRYPDSAGARQAAKIAMAAYRNLYIENQTEDKDFEKDRIVNIANYITQQWSDQPEAVEALNTLIPFMIQAGDLDMAEKYLNDIPEDSDKRGDAEIKTGQAMWSSYLKGMQDLRKWERGDEPKPEAVNVEEKKATLDQLKGRAQTILANGVQRMQDAGGVSEASVTASLSLAQIYVDTEQVDKAVALLENETIGPLALVKAGHAATSREGFNAEVYKTALRAYISSLAGASDGAAVIRKATEVMDAMKAAIDQDKLIEMYVSLARDLEEQIKLASPEAKKPLSQGFEQFLTRLRADSTELSVLNWVAATFFSLGKGFDTGVPMSAEAKRYYIEAANTYQAILDKVKKFDNPDMPIQIRLELARTKKKLGKFTDARDLFKTALTEKPMMLDVQVEASKLYQEWAGFPGKEALYQKAISGAEAGPDGKNIIWGWGRIFQITARYPDFRNVFHEARYNLAFCYLNMSKAAKSTDDKNKLLEKAKKAILQTQQLYGTGEEWLEWRPRYNTLMKDIQRASGERTEGLPPDRAAEPIETE